MIRNGCCRAMMVGAGRMTATARRDIGAVFKPDREAWVRGCVQMCDDAVGPAAISIASLLCFAPWAFDRPKHREDGVAKKGNKRCEQLRFCILMRPASTSARASYLWRLLQTETHNLSADSRRLRVTSTRS